MNAERQKCGIEPLELDAAMCKAAGIRAVELDYTGKLSHSRPNRPQNDNMSGSALDECGVSWEECGENIAGATYEMTPEELVKSWMNSPAHKENILDPIYTKWGWVIVIQAVEQEGTVITGHRNLLDKKNM